MVLVTVFSGCIGSGQKQARHIAESPKVEVGSDSSVKMGGDSQVAPRVETKKADARFTVPEGSRFEFNEKLGVMSLVLAKSSEIALNRTETKVEGPKSFQPDKAPTIKDELEAKADASLKVWFGVGSAIGIALAVFGLVRGWDFVMYGGAAVSAACLYGLFVQKHPLITGVVGIGIALAVFGPMMWHFKLKHLTNNGTATS